MPPFRRHASRSTEIETLARHLARAGAFWNIALQPRAAARTWSRSSRKSRITGRRSAKLGNADTIVLSRFAYLRRRGNELVLESPRSPALFRIVDPKIASAQSPTLSRPQKISGLRQEKDFVGLALLALLVECEILFKVDAKSDGLRARRGRRKSRGLGFSRSPVSHPLDRRPSGQSARWTLSLCRHDRAAAGRAGAMGGEPIDLRALSRTSRPRRSPRCCARVTRSASIDDAKPITLAELARLLDTAARVQSKWTSPHRLRRRRRRPRSRLHCAALPLCRQLLRARALSHGEHLRGARTRLLSLRRRPPCAGADRDAHARDRGTACGREFRDGCARPAADPDYHRRALQPDRLEVQRHRLFA